MIEKPLLAGRAIRIGSMLAGLPRVDFQ